MSLNDPHWGRDRRAPDEEDERRENEADRAAKRDDKDRVNGVNQDIDDLWRDMTSWIKGDREGGDKASDRQAADRRAPEAADKDDDDEGFPREPLRMKDDKRGQKRFDFDFLSGGRAPGSGSGRGGDRRPGFAIKLNINFGLLIAVAAVGWAASGFYIVPEGQTGIVTTFGRYTSASLPGFNWAAPAPIQSVQLVDVSSVRTITIGGRGASDALMLTDDENIVDVQFTVQYRIKSGTGARDYVFNTRNPDLSVTQAAESAMREIVGGKSMDSVLFESKAEIADNVRKLMQLMLDRYATGIEVMSVAIQNAQPPEPVQAAFNDAVKAGQDRERAINLGQAYMNAVIPKAQGTASRLKEEAEAYKARTVETARGDADRFEKVYGEYKKAPQVTRDRLYIDTMKDVYSHVTKVYVDAKGGNNLLYLPLDKIVSKTRDEAKASAAALDAEVETGADASADTTKAAGGASRRDLR